MTQEEVRGIIRDIPDFPKKGILFKDLTTAFINPDCMQWFELELTKAYRDKGITKILGIESRGFVVAPIVANELHVGFVPVRKKGKLPADVVEQSYEKEYPNRHRGHHVARQPAERRSLFGGEIQGTA